MGFRWRCSQDSLERGIAFKPKMTHMIAYLHNHLPPNWANYLSLSWNRLQQKLVTVQFMMTWLLLLYSNECPHILSLLIANMFSAPKQHWKLKITFNLACFSNSIDHTACHELHKKDTGCFEIKFISIKRLITIPAPVLIIHCRIILFLLSMHLSNAIFVIWQSWV